MNDFTGRRNLAVSNSLGALGLKKNLLMGSEFNYWQYDSDAAYKKLFLE